MEENKKLEIKALQTVYQVGEYNFFDTPDEAQSFRSNRGITSCSKVDYIGDFAGKKDVIRIWSKDFDKTYFYAVGNIPADKLEKLSLDEYTCFEMYEEGKGWRICTGTQILRYRALRARGAKFSNDIYAKVEEFLVEVHGRQPETGGKQITIGTHPETK